MSRICIPVSKEFLNKYSETIPWGIRDKVVRKIIEILIDSNQHTMYELLNPDKKFILKEDNSDGDR